SSPGAGYQTTCRSFAPRSKRALAQPIADPIDRFAHLRTGSGIAQAQEALAVYGIEVDPGRRRHTRFFEHARREREAVRREARHVGIEVEGAVDGQESVETGAVQSVEQNAPVVLIAVPH